MRPTCRSDVVRRGRVTLRLCTVVVTHLCACVKSFGNIYMYGSSHMRYKFDYLVDKCYERPVDLIKKHHNASVANLHYSWNVFSDEFGRILSDRNRTLKEKDLVFVQTGAHDLSIRGLAVTMSTGICRFVESLAELEDVSQRKVFNVVVLTSPPSRDTDNRLKTNGGRNNFVLAAFNEMMRVTAGVEVFDELSIILSRQESSTCGTHYICYNEHTIRFTGSVGLTTMQMTMASMCHLM